MSEDLKPSRIEKILIDEGYGGIPRIAWPTIILHLTCIVIQITTSMLYIHGIIEKFFAVSIITCAIFGNFTPMHDAAHGSIAARGSLRSLNIIIGYLSSCCFLLPYAAFQH